MNKYLSFTTEDFVTEDSFINWVNGTNQEDAHFWQSWQKDHPHKLADIQKARQIVENLRFEDLESRIDQETIWRNIDQHLEQKKPVNRVRAIIPWVMGIAASVLLLLFVQGSFDQSTQVNTAMAKVENHILPDNSKIKLNSNTTVDYKSASWDKQRVVSLSGEAFFEVEKGSAFVVETAYGSVEVLGTSFNVYARENGFSVTCKTGKVEVRSGKNKRVLTPGLSVYYRNGSAVKDEVFVEREKWTEGIFRYDKAPLSEVIAELERQFGETIKIAPNLTNTKFNGQFSSNDLETALSEVFWTLSLKYEINENAITILQ